MKETKLYCDNCQKDISKQYILQIIVRQEDSDSQDNTITREKTYDMCNRKCAKEKMKEMLQ